MILVSRMGNRDSRDHFGGCEESQEMDQSGSLKSRKNSRASIMHVTASQLQGSQLRVNSGLRGWIHTQGRTERVRGVQQKLSRSVKTF